MCLHIFIISSKSHVVVQRSMPKTTSAKKICDKKIVKTNQPTTKITQDSLILHNQRLTHHSLLFCLATQILVWPTPLSVTYYPGNSSLGMKFARQNICFITLKTLNNKIWVHPNF